MYIFVCVIFFYPWLSEVGDDNQSTSESCFSSHFQQWSINYHKFSSHSSSPIPPLSHTTTTKSHTANFSPVSSKHTICTHQYRPTICTPHKHVSPYDNSCTCPSNTHANYLPASNVIPCSRHASPTYPSTDTRRCSGCLPCTLSCSRSQFSSPSCSAPSPNVHANRIYA